MALRLFDEPHEIALFRLDLHVEPTDCVEERNLSILGALLVGGPTEELPHTT
ncbi:hypothetical protein [Mycolicibacterium conceptionense]|uniref:hypothetical protein n=1 Tax=Mycolicibacterium conceptionense TaxID=451644 RepID=UPI0013F6738C|nr:hypothetical protein [Mycolicibacterium conceptionense]